jgi:hypothetical protein
VLVLLLGVLLPAPAYTGPSRPQATIVISPSSGPPGTRALLRGSFSGYGSWDFISVYWDTLYSGRHLGGINMRSDGSFDLMVTIPPEAPAGTHAVWADVNAGYDNSSATFTVTGHDRTAIYIYDDDQTAADGFKWLLEDHGVDTDLVQLNYVTNADLASYDIILVGEDTGLQYDWEGSAAAREKVRGSGRPVLGLGRGGLALYAELGLFINYGQCASAGSQTQVYAYDEDLPIWNVPYRIYPANGLVTIYSQGSSVQELFAPNHVDEVLRIGRAASSTNYFPLAEEAGRYFMWGYYGAPQNMTTTGEDLFVNVVWQLIWNFDIDTLILTDYDRMDSLGYAHADVVALENDVNFLMGQPSSTTNMTALHRDLSDHGPTDIQTACATNWEGDEGDVAVTNACVEAIDEYIEALKGGAYPNLFHIILVGAHEVIPMKVREQDHLISAQEELWGLNLPGATSYMHDLYSEPGTNGWGHYLTDSIYGDLSYIVDGWGTDHELIPELAVGRLVETPVQISDLIDTYIASNGRFSRSNRVSIASNDYLDGGALAADYMGAGTDETLVQNSFDSTDIPPLLNTDNDLVYIGGHGDYNVISTGGGDEFMAGNHATQGDTAALVDMPDAVIVTSGCHNGVNFGNQLYHAPDAGTTYSEFPEEFAERLAGIYVGATGFTIISGSNADDDPNLTAHNEKLSTYIIKHLDQDGFISAGEAFRRAVNSYVTDAGAIGTRERRVIAITTLYGIPNYRPHMWILPEKYFGYWVEIHLLDPWPYIDPSEFILRVELEVQDWMIHEVGPEWYLSVPGALYGGMSNRPPLPLIKTGVVLPRGSVVVGVEWDQAASQSTTWTAPGPMYTPGYTETIPSHLRAQMTAASPEAPPAVVHDEVGLFPAQPHAAYSTTTSAGLGTLAGLNIIPLQHNPRTLETTLWTKLVFSVTCQAAPSTDADGDGLPGYWEGSKGLDPNDGSGDDGASGDPEGDGLPNDDEFGQGTDPLDPDTDDDGWTDGAEDYWGTDPLNPGDHPYSVFLPVVSRNYP